MRASEDTAERTRCDVTCAEYRDLVAADVDGVLGGSEVEGTRRHRASCESCRTLRERQLAIRDLLRSRCLQEATPYGLRTRIVARLEEESRRIVAAKWRRFVPWVGLVLAGAAAAAVMTLWNRAGSFAPLIESYDLAARGALHITFATSEPTVLESYYRQHAGEGFPEHVVDLSPAGFHLIGGLLKDFPDREARLSVYSDGTNVIVCDYQFAKAFPLALPASGEPIFFSRHGVNFSAHRMGAEVCLLATRMPMERFRMLVGNPTAG